MLRGQIDNALLQRRHEPAHTDIGASNVDQRVHHELAGPVKCDLAAAVDLHDRDITWRQQVLLACIQTQREHGWMFAEPDFVRCRRVALVGERLHFAPQRHVIPAAEKARFHSAIRTSE